MLAAFLLPLGVTPHSYRAADAWLASLKRVIGREMAKVGDARARRGGHRPSHAGFRMTDAASPTPPDPPRRRRRKRAYRPNGGAGAMLPPVIRVEIQNLERLGAREAGPDPGRDDRLRAAERAVGERQALLDAAEAELAAREEALRVRAAELEATGSAALPEGGDRELVARARGLDERERDLEARRAILEADLELREEEAERREARLASREERLDERERELGVYVSQIQGQLESRAAGW